MRCAFITRNITTPKPGQWAQRITAAFLFSAATILLVTALLKIVGTTQASAFFNDRAPLLEFLTTRELMLVAAALELTIVVLILLHRSTTFRLWLVLWLTTLFTIFRLGLWAIGFKGYCPCLGGVVKWFLSNRAGTDRGLELLLAYFGFASVYCLILEKRNRKSPRRQAAGSIAEEC